MKPHTRFALPHAQRQAVWEPIRDALAQRPEVLAVVLYGSFLNEETFRDVDIGLLIAERCISPEDFLDYELARLDELSSQCDHPLDIRTVNHAPVLFRYAVTQGRLLFCRDADAWSEFCERTWDEYFDFEPVARLYLEELARG